MADPTPPSGPTLEQLTQYAALFTRTVTLKHYGLRINFPSVDRVEVLLDSVQPEHRGGLGTSAVNGGVLAAIFDLAIGCTPALMDPTRRSATMHLSMNFERPVLGDSVRAEAWIDSAGSSTIFAGAQIYDAQGQVCARCQGVAKIARIPWEGGTPAQQ
ncbi:MAG TPA: PaaI family thioesterase [Myxococcaceae bacterium]|nr:PaaI family thioesterase [Myxococcaceae bacterium]